MGKRLRADQYRQSVLSIDPASLRDYHAVLLDYDNTLAPWRHPLSTETIGWLRAIPIPVYVLSNGRSERIAGVMQPIGVKSRGKCMKPFAYRISKYLRSQGIDSRKCVFIGDNLITDIWTGNRLGCTTIRVEPLSPHEHPATRFWRILELLFAPRLPREKG
jgi:HAD superfamily phosphatase (TIGR01668 family)